MAKVNPLYKEEYENDKRVVEEARQEYSLSHTQGKNPDQAAIDAAREHAELVEQNFNDKWRGGLYNRVQEAPVGTPQRDLIERQREAKNEAHGIQLQRERGEVSLDEYKQSREDLKSVQNQPVPEQMVAPEDRRGVVSDITSREPNPTSPAPSSSPMPPRSQMVTEEKTNDYSRVQVYDKPVNIDYGQVRKLHSDSYSRYEDSAQWARNYRPVDLVKNLPSAIEGSSSYVSKNNVDFVDGGNSTNSRNWTGTISGNSGEGYRLDRVNVPNVDNSIVARENEMKANATILGLSGSVLSGSGSYTRYNNDVSSKAAVEARTKLSKIATTVEDIYGTGGQEWLQDLSKASRDAVTNIRELGGDKGIGKVSFEMGQMTQAANESSNRMIAMNSEYRHKVRAAKRAVEDYNEKARKFNSIAGMRHKAADITHIEALRPKLNVPPIEVSPVYPSSLTDAQNAANTAPGNLSGIADGFIDKHTGKTDFSQDLSTRTSSHDPSLGGSKSVNTKDGNYAPQAGGGSNTGGGGGYSGGGGGGGGYSGGGGGGSYGPSRRGGGSSTSRSSGSKKSKNEKLEDAAKKISDVLNGKEGKEGKDGSSNSELAAAAKKKLEAGEPLTPSEAAELVKKGILTPEQAARAMEGGATGGSTGDKRRELAEAGLEPKPGDSPEVIAEKARLARQMGAGDAFDEAARAAGITGGGVGGGGAGGSAGVAPAGTVPEGTTTIAPDVAARAGLPAGTRVAPDGTLFSPAGTPIGTLGPDGTPYDMNGVPMAPIVGEGPDGPSLGYTPGDDRKPVIAPVISDFAPSESGGSGSYGSANPGVDKALAETNLSGFSPSELVTGDVATKSNSLGYSAGTPSPTSPAARVADAALVSPAAPAEGDRVRATALGADMRPLDRNGDGRMSPGAVSPTRAALTNPDGTPKKVPTSVVVDGVEYPMEMSDPRLKEMMDIMAGADPDSPIDVLEAARRAGINLSSYGDSIDPDDAQPGDVVVGPKGQGFYLGDGKVLMSDGTVKNLDEVLVNNPPESGMFRLAMPELPEYSTINEPKNIPGGVEGANPDAEQNAITGGTAVGGGSTKQGDKGFGGGAAPLAGGSNVAGPSTTDYDPFAQDGPREGGSAITGGEAPGGAAGSSAETQAVFHSASGSFTSSDGTSMRWSAAAAALTQTESLFSVDTTQSQRALGENPFNPEATIQEVAYEGKALGGSLR